jgi:hypothetical protein
MAEGKMAKPKSTAKLLNLPDAQQLVIADWMFRGLGYEKIVGMVEQEFRIKTSPQALSRFWNVVCEPIRLGRRARRVQASERVADEAKKQPGRWDEATIDLIKQKAFDVADDPNADPETVVDLVSLILKVRGQDQEDRKIELASGKLQLELRKYQDAVAAAKSELEGARKAGGLQPETLAKVEEALKLL